MYKKICVVGENYFRADGIEVVGDGDVVVLEHVFLDVTQGPFWEHIEGCTSVSVVRNCCDEEDQGTVDVAGCGAYRIPEVVEMGEVDDG